MKKIRILLCLAILLTGCSSLGSSDADYMKYADSSEEVAAVAGTIVDTAVKKPQETTTPAETLPPEPEKPKLTDEELNSLENTEKGLLYLGSKEAIQGKVKELLDEAGRQGVVIGADCTVPSDISSKRIDWVKEAVAL